MFDLTNPIFNDEDKAREHLEALRWPDGPVCVHCGTIGNAIARIESTGQKTKPVAEGKKHRPARKGLYYCNNCHQQFSVTVGTVLEKSHIQINKWIAAFYMMCASKKGVSAHQLHRQLKITYKSAWFMAHRVREAMRSGGLAPPMGGNGGTVEIDETVVGRASTHPKGRAKARSSSHKNVVLSLVERGGSVRSYHVTGSTVSEIMPIIDANISHEASVMTDAASWYKYMNDGGRFISHDRVDHSKDEYVRQEGDRLAHTNTVENYYSVFKRGMRGVYQHCSEKHLHRYLAEFDYRYSNRSKLGIEDTERTNKALRQIEGRRLTYRRIGRPIDEPEGPPFP